jgi:hypothetical protein
MWGKLISGVLCLLGVASLAFAGYALTWPAPVSDGTGGPRVPEPWSVAVVAGLFGLLLLVLAWLAKDMLDTAERLHDGSD